MATRIGVANWFGRERFNVSNRWQPFEYHHTHYRSRTKERITGNMDILNSDQELFTSNEVAQAAGVTYRQLDYWLRTGWLNIDGNAHGSGSRREFTRAEALALVRMVQRYTAARREVEDIRSGRAWREEIVQVRSVT